MLFVLRTLHDGRCQRMLAGAFQAGTQPQHFIFLESGERHDCRQFRFTLGQRAGLVHHQRVHFLHDFQRFGILDQHTGRRAPSGADHDGHRRGQSQRAGTGDDEHGHGVDDGMRQARFRSPDAPCRQV